jgi:hypothetical protein
LSHRVRIDCHVGNPAVAHFHGECFPQGGGRVELGIRCREESDHHQGTDASGDQADRQVSTLFQIPNPRAQTWEAYRQHPLLQGPHPKVGALSCALRGEDVPPFNFADPRTSGLDLKASTLLRTSASGVRGLATVTSIVLIPP